MSVQPNISQDPESYGVADSGLHDVKNSQLTMSDVAEVLEEGTITSVDPQDEYATVEGKIERVTPFENHAKEIQLLLNPFEEPKPQVVRVFEQDS